MISMIFTALVLILIPFSTVSTQYGAPEGIDVKKYADYENNNELKEDITNAEPSKFKGFHVLLEDKALSIPSHSSSNRLEIFCYNGDSKTIASLFRSVEMHLRIESVNFRHYQGQNATDVKIQYAETSWFSLSPWRSTSFSLHTFSASCIGIETREPFDVVLIVKNLDGVRVGLFISAIILYLLSPSIARNIFFHYLTGSFIGVLGSLIIILFIFSKFVPRRTGSVVFLVGGSGFILYAVQFFYERILHFAYENSHLVGGYIAVSILISVVVVYRWGPFSDHRTLKIIQWFLQLIAIALLYSSSQHKDFIVAVIAGLLCITLSPSVLWRCFGKLWRRISPPKVKLLSQDEYIHQGQIETEKALEELREFCKSPQCNAWRTFGKLQTPKRFAEFVEGSQYHVIEEEMDEFETSYYGRGFRLPTDENIITDDESSDD